MFSGLTAKKDAVKQTSVAVFTQLGAPVAISGIDTKHNMADVIMSTSG
jgi:hypothetical protein